MLRRWHVLLLILVTLAAFCGLTAAKLRATPKFDRIQDEMTLAEVKGVLGHRVSRSGSVNSMSGVWFYDEGEAAVNFRWAERLEGNEFELRVAGKTISRRGPLERLAWLAGWR
jgi:hypothetical protein